MAEFLLVWLHQLVAEESGQWSVCVHRGDRGNDSSGTEMVTGRMDHVIVLVLLVYDGQHYRGSESWIGRHGRHLQLLENVCFDGGFYLERISAQL